MIQYLRNVLHATSVITVVATITSTTKKYPNKINWINYLYSCLLEKIVLLLTLLVSLLHYCQHCSTLLCIWLTLILLLLNTMGPRSKVMIYEKSNTSKGPTLCTLGTIAWHCPTSHWEVWLHVLPLPTSLNISPYWWSLLERMSPLGLLSISWIVDTLKLVEVSFEVTSKVACWDNPCSLSTTKSLTFSLLLKDLHASLTLRSYRFLTHTLICFACPVRMCLRKTFSLLNIT